jgi:putative toxin-antitoxin system antitoxin component (TIGR02293 family)
LDACLGATAYSEGDGRHPEIAPTVWDHAVDTFGSVEKAELWFRTPLWELGERTPEQVLRENPASPEVEAVLIRIDYGVFS